MMKTLLLVLAVCTTQVLSASVWSSIFGSENSWTKPSFCRSYDCPEFTVLKETDDYELRQYGTTHWVMTEMEREDPMWEDADKMREPFMKLFRYIQGSNAEKKKMPMTVPVLMTHERNKVMMGFMIPSDVGDKAPLPNDRTVTLVTRRSQQLYVRSFGGFAYGWWYNKNYYKTEYEALKEALKRDGITPNESKFLTAGYDSPWTIFYRHNEVAIAK